MHPNIQLYMYPPPRRKQKIKKILNQATATRLAVHPQHHPHPYTHPLKQATATRLAVHIQHHPHPHTSAQPHTSNTAAYIHKSTTSHHHNQELLKKSPRGVQRGHGFMAPLRFSSFPTKTPKNIFLPTFPSKVCIKINKILVVFTIKKVYHIKINYKQ